MRPPIARRWPTSRQRLEHDGWRRDPTARPRLIGARFLRLRLADSDAGAQDGPHKTTSAEPEPSAVVS